MSLSYSWYLFSHRSTFFATTFVQMLRRVFGANSVLPFERPAGLQFLKQVWASRITLFFYGYNLTEAVGGKLIFLRILRIIFPLFWVMRLVRYHVYLSFKTLFSITGYMTELIIIIHHFWMISKLTAIQNFFHVVQSELDLLNVQQNEYTNRIRAINWLNLFIITVVGTITGAMSARSIAFYEDFLSNYEYLIYFHTILLDAWILGSCALYSVGLTAHFIRCDVEMKKFKSAHTAGGELDYDEVLELVYKLNGFHSKFEETFSFMPFWWLSYCWSCATIYIIGVAFGPMKSIFEIPLILWCTSLQVVTFVTVWLAIFVQRDISLRYESVIYIFDRKLSKATCNCPKMIYLFQRMAKMAKMPFTAMGFYSLQKPLVFSYLVSLISFSVLTLQLDTTETPRQSQATKQ